MNLPITTTEDFLNAGYTLNELVKTKLYDLGPQTKVGSMPTTYTCPICRGDLEDFARQNSPDDYDFVAFCPVCKETWD